jgi:hypothetical protein
MVLAMLRHSGYIVSKGDGMSMISDTLRAAAAIVAMLLMIGLAGESASYGLEVPYSAFSARENGTVKICMDQSKSKSKTAVKTAAETKKEKMLRWDKKFQKLSDKNRKKFIRYWVKHYSKKMGVNVNGGMAVRHALKETSYGRAGVGRKHKKNLFGFQNSYTGYKFSTYRASCKAFVRYTKHFYPGLAKSGKNGRMYQ